MMLDSSVLQIMSFYGGLIFTFYYILATTLPGILTDVYGFSPALTGYSFLTFSATVSIMISNIFLDRLYNYLSTLHSEFRPENRLPLLILGALLMPFSIVLYALAPTLFPSHPSLSLTLLLLSVALQGVFLLLISVSLAAYIVDAFGLYSASAMTIVLIASAWH
ncbi:hypothetical protein G7Y89_g10495 [Cudoniella acicularis]|uniref:MFS transporter n=1 Tax=Cudoniella acicularis TaxID=354080 RepID=A0A8H4W1K0_9HELO|nr:hypothetical protein G7Y89_g10495 [Cudoniella acicularis]